MSMRSEKADGGYVFHGGCNGCSNPMGICPCCCYMRPDWNLPDLNPVHIKQKAEKERMIEKAIELSKNERGVNE